MGEAATRLPKQHRSRRTLQRIARAALELIAQNGVEGTTVGAIVRRAGSSVGSFYARFDGKGDLLLYLDERIWEAAEPCPLGGMSAPHGVWSRSRTVHPRLTSPPLGFEWWTLV